MSTETNEEKVDVSKLKIRTEVFSRVVGYYSPISHWNEGKRAEWNERKTFKLKDIVPQTES